jgi:hypothetical protein
MILDPHSCLWDANLSLSKKNCPLDSSIKIFLFSVCVVHDVSNHWLRFKLDEEILKCLYAHPNKEAILILNKVKTNLSFIFNHIQFYFSRLILSNVNECYLMSPLYSQMVH